MKFADSCVDEMGVQQGAIDEKDWKEYSLDDAKQALLTYIKEEQEKAIIEVRLDELNKAETHISWTAGYADDRRTELESQRNRLEQS
jgi:hypothetical protein